MKLVEYARATILVVIPVATANRDPLTRTKRHDGRWSFYICHEFVYPFTAPNKLMGIMDPGLHGIRDDEFCGYGNTLT